MSAPPPWKKAPLLRILPALIAGILWQSYHPLSEYILQIGILVAALCCVPTLFLPLQPRTRIITGGCWLLLWVLVGAWRMQSQDIRNQTQWLGHGYAGGQALWLRINHTPIAGAKSFRSTATVQARYDQGAWMPSYGTVLVYGRSGLPAAGTALITRQPLQIISNAKQSGTFDMAAYYARQNIFHQLWLRDYQAVGRPQPPFFDRLQQSCLHIIEHSIPGKQEAGVAAALLMGYRGGLDADIKAAYQRTGVIHVIAISGLHLGMMYGLLSWLLGPLRRYYWSNAVRIVLILGLLWGFTLLAGAGPSVTRSAWMFSLIALAQFFQQQTHALHGLTLAACLLLLINPYDLWDLGFLLSFTAVAGILFFQRPLETLWPLPNHLFRKIWQMCSITLSAQLATLPILLYQFQQFPNLFLFTNLLVVPASGLLLYGCMAILPVYGLYTNAALGLGQITGWGIHQLNRLIEKAAALPYAVTENISLSFSGACTCYALIVLPLCYQPKRKQRLLIAALGIVVIGMGLRCCAAIISLV